jgi:hypothetical protein
MVATDLCEDQGHPMMTPKPIPPHYWVQQRELIEKERYIEFVEKLNKELNFSTRDICELYEKQFPTSPETYNMLFKYINDANEINKDSRVKYSFKQADDENISYIVMLVN